MKETPSSSPEFHIDSRPSISEEDYRKEQPYLTLVLNNFLSDYLLRLYEAFDGDFIQVIVLANIAHHNVEHMINRLEYDVESVRQIFLAADANLDWMRPCNAFSISEALKIPRETVRRKVAFLIRKGWLRQNEKKELFVTRLPSEVFFHFNVALTNQLLRTADLLRARIAGRGDRSISPDMPPDR